MADLTYPLSLNGYQGLNVTSSYPSLVRESLLSVVVTKLEERVYRPDYGNPLEAFENVSDLPRALAELRQAIQSAIALSYPDVAFDLSGYFDEEGELRVEVSYLCPDGSQGAFEV